MSNDINKMDVKQLRNEVQLLRDELAIMQRKYEDILYNLDDDNFSSRFVKEKNNLKTAITQTEKEIKLQASAIDENTSAISSLSITAERITSRVEQTENDLVSYAEMALTSDEVYSIVSTEYIKDRVDGEYATSDDIYILQSSINQNAESITMIVSDESSGEKSIFKQTSNGGFQLTGDVSISGVDNNLYLGSLDSNWDKKTIYFNSQANVGTFNFQGLGQDGLVVSANGFGIDCRPDYIYLVSPDGSSFANGRITLAEYVSQYGSGGSGSGTVVAVFG